MCPLSSSLAAVKMKYELMPQIRKHSLKRGRKRLHVLHICVPVNMSSVNGLIIISFAW